MGRVVQTPYPVWAVRSFGKESSELSLNAI
jgi:hypothetical protein